MAKYIKTFNNQVEYDVYANSGDWVTPNVCAIKDIIKVKYQGKIPIKLCDIVYWNGKHVLTTSPERYKTSFGTPIGVVVIPESFLPDGKCRIVALNNATDKIGLQSMMWCDSYEDSILNNYNMVPITDNAGSTTIGSNNFGYLPSDIFNGNNSIIDNKTKYHTDINNIYYIPSPYNGEVFNNEYAKNINGTNVLSDLNGLDNTKKLKKLGEKYFAANSAYEYNDGASNLQWYLPSAVEIGFLIARLKEINDVILQVNGNKIDEDTIFWTSTECNSDMVYCVGTKYGGIGERAKDYSNKVLPFSII